MICCGLENNINGVDEIFNENRQFGIWGECESYDRKFTKILWN